MPAATAATAKCTRASRSARAESATAPANATARKTQKNIAAGWYVRTATTSSSVAQTSLSKC